MTAGESVEPVTSKAASASSKKTKAEQAFQKAKEERVTDHWSVCVDRVLFM